jgi:hypothetical protein
VTLGAHKYMAASTTAAQTTSKGVKYTRPGLMPFTARTMRTSGFQQFDTEVFPLAAGQINVQKNIPLLQPLAHVGIKWSGRLTVTVSITDSPPEVGLNVFSQIKIFGTHVSLGSETPVQMSGEWAGRLPGLVDRAKGSGIAVMDVTSGGVTTYYVIDDFSKGVFTPTFFAAGGSPYDINVRWIIPTYPMGVLDFNALQYLWDARSWGQTMQMQFQTRDASAVGAFGTTGTKVLSAYGSATGNPSVQVLLDYANLGPKLDASIAKAVLVRTTQGISQFLTAALPVGSRLLLMQNKKTLNVLVKTGTIETGSNNVYASLSDSIIAQTQLLKNASPIRNLVLNDMTDFLSQFREARRHAPGYLVIGCDDGEPANNPHAAIRANEWGAATQFNLASQVVTGAATNLGEALQEYVDGEPVIAQAASSSGAVSASTASTT